MVINRGRLQFIPGVQTLLLIRKPNVSEAGVMQTYLSCMLSISMVMYMGQNISLQYKTWAVTFNPPLHPPDKRGKTTNTENKTAPVLRRWIIFFPRGMVNATVVIGLLMWRLFVSSLSPWRDKLYRSFRWHTAIRKNLSGSVSNSSVLILCNVLYWRKRYYQSSPWSNGHEGNDGRRPHRLPWIYLFRQQGAIFILRKNPFLPRQWEKEIEIQLKGRGKTSLRTIALHETLTQRITTVYARQQTWRRTET